MTNNDREREVLALFAPRAKTAIDSNLTAILGGAGGAFAGQALSDLLAAKFPAFQNPAVQKATQALVGGTGGYLGKVLGDRMSDAPPPLPQNAPYALDPTDQDIPDWAVQGARFLQPAAKMGSAGPWYDMPLGEIPGYGFVEGAREGRGAKGALKGGLASIGGGVGGALAGTALGKGIEHFTGFNPNIPGIHMNFSDILAGLGGTIGATAGFRHAVR